MQDGISGPFIRHPIATTLLMVAILVAGIVVYPKLPVAPLPQVDFPTIQVSASLPGPSLQRSILLSWLTGRTAVCRTGSGSGHR